jgi:predicted nucleic acid-binding protein
MAVVVDASAVGAIMFGEPEGETLTAHLEGETLLAPRLLDYELVNLALKKARKHPTSLPAIVVSLRGALKLPISRVDVPGFDVFRLAAETGLTAYDASYLWLARLRDAELVTLDRNLARAAESRQRA